MGTVHAKDLPKSGDEVEKHESNPMDLQKLLARVDKVHIDGVVRTKRDVLVKAVQGLFKAGTFKDVVLEAHQAKKYLESIGAFKDVGIFIDTCQGEQCTPDGLEITFHVLEVKRATGGINTLVGNNSGSLSIGNTLPNLFGRGEKIQLEYSRGTQSAVTCNLSFMKPFVGPLNTKFTTSVYQDSGDLVWSGIKQLDRGICAELAFNSLQNINHRLRVESIWRELACLNNQTAFDIREEMGHNLKCSFKHSFAFDHRDSSIIPTTGVLLKFDQELCGLAGDVSLNKHELELQLNKRLPYVPETSIQACFKAGIIKSNSKSTCIADRFFIGGPLNLRGFTFNGCGPSSRGFSLGADAYWSSALHLYSPLPFRPGKGGFGDLFRLHLFVNAGDIKNNFLDSSFTLEDQLKSLRLVYGAGIILRIGEAARFELNYCVPLKVQQSDTIVHGLQFGIGVSFL